MSQDKKELIELLKSVASDDTARKTYAETRAEVLLPLVDAQSTVRTIYTPETLNAGAQSNYPISFDYTEFAGYMPKFGGAFTQVVEGDELYIPTFGIEAGGRYAIDIARDGRLDLANQVMRQIANKIIEKEEKAGWATIKGALSGFNANQTIYCSGTTENFHSFSKKAIVKMMVQMDIQRRVLDRVYVSPRSLGDILEWSQTSVDFLTQREIFQNGGLPGQSVWNIKFDKVYNSNIVSDAEAFGFDTRTFGKMPIRQMLTTYEDPTAILDWQVGIIARELVGFGVTDSWAVVKAVLDSTHAGSACSNL